tara:strand:- start:608 stop:850 length:243 start_codon:yes stop_codon:yes gene_type:complete
MINKIISKFITSNISKKFYIDKKYLNLKKVDLYEYFKLPVEERIKIDKKELQIKKEKKILINLYEYFKLPADKRKYYKIF